MERQIYVGLFTEGSIDQRYLIPIVECLLADLSYQSRGDIVFQVFPIPVSKSGLDFPEQVLAAAKAAHQEWGAHLLCVHTDADNEVSTRAYQTKIAPALSQLAQQPDQAFSKMLMALVPVYETEAWMLADLDLLKSEIGTELSGQDLGLARPPERIARPKEAIAEAIRRAQAHRPRRHRYQVQIDELYAALGPQTELKKLAQLPSFRDFEQNLRAALQKLNFLD
jgi:hypothetical protein